MAEPPIRQSTPPTAAGSTRSSTFTSYSASFTMSSAITVGDKLPSATFVTDGSKKEVTTEELCKGGSQAKGPEPLAMLIWAYS